MPIFGADVASIEPSQFRRITATLKNLADLADGMSATWTIAKSAQQAAATSGIRVKTRYFVATLMDI